MLFSEQACGHHVGGPCTSLWEWPPFESLYFIFAASIGGFYNNVSLFDTVAVELQVSAFSQEVRGFGGSWCLLLLFYC